MKKSMIFVLFALVSVFSYSQVSWNVKAGLNMSNITGSADTDMKLGFQAGVGMEYALTDMFSIQPSLLLSTKGFKFDTGKLASELRAEKLKFSVNAMYLEMPVMGAARFAVADGQNVVVKAGPYFGYGIGGKTKIGDIKINTFGKTTTGGLELEGCNRFDFGLAVGAAYEINSFFVDLTGSFGLVGLGDSMMKGIDSPKNINFTVGVGYKF